MSAKGNTAIFEILINFLILLRVWFGIIRLFYKKYFLQNILVNTRNFVKKYDYCNKHSKKCFSQNSKFRKNMTILINIWRKKNFLVKTEIFFHHIGNFPVRNKCARSRQKPKNGNQASRRTFSFLLFTRTPTPIYVTRQMTIPLCLKQSNVFFVLFHSPKTRKRTNTIRSIRNELTPISLFLVFFFFFVCMVFSTGWFIFLLIFRVRVCRSFYSIEIETERNIVAVVSFLIIYVRVLLAWCGWYFLVGYFVCVLKGTHSVIYGASREYYFSSASRPNIFLLYFFSVLVGEIFFSTFLN